MHAVHSELRGGANRPISEQERTLIIDRLKRGDKVRAVAAQFGRGEASIRAVAKRANLKLTGRTTGNRHAAKNYTGLQLEIPEVILSALKAAADRRDATVEQLAVGILAGVLTGGNIESTLGRNGGYLFMRIRPPAEREYHRQWKEQHKTRSAEAASVAGVKRP
jgi:hypothetical protein